ncbi:MAG TPA: hypothetical protein VKU19_28020 [Bryobacteraceae bacterium]|nr:hypothetical protein [Bryobacteraceae bacterium]
MPNSASLTCALTLGVTALFAQTVPVSSTVETTGMIGLADAQTAQLNLLNPGVLAPALGVVCTAGVSFVDSSGTVLKTATLVVPPGKSMALDLRSDTDLKLAAGDRREIRATISIPSIVPPPNAAAPAASTSACKLVPTLEILDTPSGRTLVTLGHVVTIASPGSTTP